VLSGNVRLAFIVNEVPSTESEQHLLGVLHVGIDLTVFEETAGVEYVRVRIHRFVTEYSPSLHSTGCKKQFTEMDCVPRVVHDRRASGDELSLIYIIFHQPLWGP